MSRFKMAATFENELLRACCLEFLSEINAFFFGVSASEESSLSRRLVAESSRLFWIEYM